LLIPARRLLPPFKPLSFFDWLCHHTCGFRVWLMCLLLLAW
jgi:hypothetical protein